MGRERRASSTVAGLVAAVVLGTVLVGCIPEPWAVDTTSDLADPTPGDGICGDGTAGTCSLRAAIQEANASGDATQITLTPATYQLAIPGPTEGEAKTGDLDIKGNLTIKGAGATVHGGGLDRVFDVWENATLDLSSVTITGGATNGAGFNFEGGGIRTRGNLTLTTSTITANTSTTAGGGISVGATPGQPQGTATITASTLDHNTAPAGGALVNDGATTITTSTLVANTATNATAPAGHALLQRAGTLGIEWSTIGGQAATTATLELTGGTGTIGGLLMEKTSSCQGAWVRNQFSQFGKGCPRAPMDGEIVAQDIFPALADNGGPTRTILMPTSRGIQQRGLTCPSLDQRLLPRPNSTWCDFGAVEVQFVPTTYTLTSTADEVDADPADGVCATAGGTCTLRAAVQQANADPSQDTIVSPPDFPVTLTLPGLDEEQSATGDLDIRHGLTLQSVDVRGGPGWNDRIFDVRASQPVRFDLVTVSGGRAIGAGIMGRANTDLTITNSNIHHNTSTSIRACRTRIQTSGALTWIGCSSSQPGGAVYVTGSLTMKASTVHSNVADAATTCWTSVTRDPIFPELVDTVEVCTYNYFAGLGSQGPLRIEDSTITGNQRINPVPSDVGESNFSSVPGSTVIINSTIDPT